MNTIQQTLQLGQSIWYDDISLESLTSGLLLQQRELGVTGVTSNPAIFKKAITGSLAYDSFIAEQPAEKTDDQILEDLMIADVTAACDLFAPVYQSSNGADGFVSLEVSPKLAHSAQDQTEAGLRIAKKINRPNSMIKIPATNEGIEAIENLIAAGVNVNATLIFSPVAYRAVAEAYLKGLERWIENGSKGTAPQSVASVFVSRLDAAIDQKLIDAGLEALRNHLGIDNCRLIYQDFKRLFSGSRWERLAAQGCRVQRPLWASTSVKTKGLAPTAYVDQLIGEHTVNTVPPATLQAFLSEGTAQVHVQDNIPQARARLAELAAAEIDVEAVNNQLLIDGLDAFVKAYEDLIAAVTAKR